MASSNGRPTGGQPEANWRLLCNRRPSGRRSRASLHIRISPTACSWCCFPDGRYKWKLDCEQRPTAHPTASNAWTGLGWLYYHWGLLAGEGPVLSWRWVFSYAAVEMAKKRGSPRGRSFRPALIGRHSANLKIGHLGRRFRSVLVWFGGVFACEVH